MFAASVFTLGIGDLVALVSVVGLATAGILAKLSALKTDIERSARRHEARCHNFAPQPGRGPVTPVDLQDTGS